MRLASIVVSCFFAFCVLLAGQESVGIDSRPFTVKYRNGATEKYLAEWTATVDVDKSESGGPAKPLEGKLVDDRKCHWTIVTTVVRRLYLTNQTGERFEKKDFATPHAVKFANQGSDFKLEQLRPENCGDAEARFQSDLTDARNAAKNALPQVIDSDAKTVKSILRGWPNVVDVM